MSKLLRVIQYRITLDYIQYSGIGVDRKGCKLMSGPDNQWSGGFLYEDREVGAMDRTVGSKFSNLTS